MAFGEDIDLEISTSDFFARPRSAIVEIDTKGSNLNTQQPSIVSVCVCVCVCVCCVTHPSVVYLVI